MRIVDVTETHIHADFVSGTRELASATGARMLLSGEGGEDWQYAFADSDHATLLHNGDVIDVGRVRLHVMHTPGHTPEHLSFVVTDTARSDEPVAMISGDFVFVGDVGRPDLLEVAAGHADTKEHSARQLYHSLRRLETLPDHLQIWPGHGAGSACGKALGSMPNTTLGYERRSNWAFGAIDENTFVTTVLDGQPIPPAYFARMKSINRAGPPVLGHQHSLREATLDELDDALMTGIVVDTRPLEAYAAAHVAGTINIPLLKAFTGWAGWLIPYDRPIYLIADTPAAAERARKRLSSIGLDNIDGLFDACRDPRKRSSHDSPRAHRDGAGIAA